MPDPLIVDAFWSRSPDVERRARGIVHHWFADSVRPNDRAWIDIAGGVVFGCGPVEQVIAYQNLSSESVDGLEIVVAAMELLDAAGILMVERLANRVTPMKIDQAVDRWSEETVQATCSAGICHTFEDRQGRSVVHDVFELRPAILFELERRHLLWELYWRYSISQMHALRDLQQWRESGVVTGYRVSCCEDSCPSCRAIAGKVRALDAPPPIPNFFCQGDNGCRCSLIAELDIEW